MKRSVAVLTQSILKLLRQVSPNPTSRIHSTHPNSSYLGDPTSQFKQEDLPYGKKAIGTKWVYRNKKDERGVIVINKARSHQSSSHLSAVRGGEEFLDSNYAETNLTGKSTNERQKNSCCNLLRASSWIQNQMLDYGFNFMNIKIYIDNESTVCIVKNPLYHSKTKHIAIRHHFIRYAYEKKLIQVLKIHTDDNVADLLTKAFDVSRHLDAKKKFVMYPRFISIFLDKQLANVSVPLDHFPVNTLTSKVFSFMVKKGKHFSGKVTPLFATMLVQPTQDEGAPSERPSEAQPTPSPAPTSEVPNEPQTDSSPAQTSEVPIEQQTDLSPRPSPTPIIPDSIPETSGENLGGHSSSDKSLSGNEGDMTLQSVYDLCLSLCAQVSDQAKEIQHLKAQITKLKKQAKPVIKHHRAWLQSVSLKQRFPRKNFSKKHRVHKESVSKQGRKFAKGESSVQRDPLFDEIPEDTVDHMETENAQDEGRTREMVDEDKEIDENILSTEDVLSTDKEGVSTDMEKVSTDRPIVSTDGSKVSTDRQNEGTEEHIEGTEGQNEGTEEHNEGTEEQFESTDGQRKGTEDHTEEEIAAQATQTPTQTPTSTIFGDDETIAKTDFLLRRFKNKKERQFTIEERAKILHVTIAAQKKSFLLNKIRAIRNKPPTKNPTQKLMMTYLKHYCDEISSLLGAAEDERLIKRMNEKGVDSSKSEVPPGLEWIRRKFMRKVKKKFHEESKKEEKLESEEDSTKASWRLIKLSRRYLGQSSNLKKKIDVIEKEPAAPKKATASSKKKITKRKLVLKDKTDDEEDLEHRPLSRKKRIPKTVVIQEPLSAPVKQTYESFGKHKGIEMLSDAAQFEFDTLKAQKASKHESILQHHPGGSSEGTDSKLGVLDELTGKSAVLDEGAGIQSEVPDETKNLNQNESKVSEDDQNKSEDDDERVETDDDQHQGKGNADMNIEQKVEKKMSEEKPEEGDITSMMDVHIQQDVPNVMPEPFHSVTVSVIPETTQAPPPSTPATITLAT
ncbi:hypothetical protein Tco_0443386 [Tanacetum coccineum]